MRGGARIEDHGADVFGDDRRGGGVRRCQELGIHRKRGFVGGRLFARHIFGGVARSRIMPANLLRALARRGGVGYMVQEAGEQSPVFLRSEMQGYIYRQGR